MLNMKKTKTSDGWSGVDKSDRRAGSLLKTLDQIIVAVGDNGF